MFNFRGIIKTASNNLKLSTVPYCGNGKYIPRYVNPLKWSASASREDATCDLLQFETPDSVCVPQYFQGAWCIAANNPFGATMLYIKTPRVLDFSKSSVSLEVEFFEDRKAKMWVEYDSTDQSVTVISDQRGAFKRTRKVRLRNTGKWRTVRFKIRDAHFGLRCNDADFRIMVSGGENDIARFRRVSLTSPILCQSALLKGQNTSEISLKTSNEPEVSIIMPVFNKSEFTLQCARYIEKHAPKTKFELLIVDNASRPDEFKNLQSIKGVQIIRLNENLGFAKACNLGAQRASGKYLLFLNNDTIPTNGWLDSLVECARKNTDAGVFGSKLLFPESGLVQHAGVYFNEQGLPYHRYEFCDSNESKVNKTGFTPAVTGASMLVPRVLFEKLGAFDEGYLNGYEDIDFCLRAQDLGRKVIYCAESQLFHYQSLTEGRLKNATEERNKSLFQSRWKSTLMNIRTPDDEETFPDYNRRLETQTDTLILCSHDASRTGAPLIILKIAELLHTRHRIKCKIFLIQGGPLVQEFQAFGEVFILDENMVHGNQNVAAMRFKIANLLDENTSFALCNSSESHLVISELAKHGLKILSLIHEFMNTYPQIVIDRLCHSSSKIILPSDIVLHSLESRSKQRLTNTEVMPQGIFKDKDYTQPEFDSARRLKARQQVLAELSLSETTKIVLGSGYVDNRKGCDYFMLTCQMMRARYPEMDFAFIWVGKKRARFADKNFGLWLTLDQDKAGLENHLFFVGEREEPADYFLAADVFFMCSRLDPFPCVVLEAMSAAIPVVCFEKTIGSVELLLSGAGTVVPPFHLLEAADAIAAYLADDQLRTEAGKIGQALIKSNFQYVDYVDALVFRLEEMGFEGHMGNTIRKSDSVIAVK